MYGRQASGAAIYNMSSEQSYDYQDEADTENEQSVWQEDSHPDSRSMAQLHPEDPSYDMQYLRVASPRHTGNCKGPRDQPEVDRPFRPRLCASPSPRSRTRVSLMAKLDREAVCEEASRNHWLEKVQAEQRRVACGPWGEPQAEPDFIPPDGLRDFRYADQVSARSSHDALLQQISPDTLGRSGCSAGAYDENEGSLRWGHSRQNEWYMAPDNRNAPLESPSTEQVAVHRHAQISTSTGQRYPESSRASSEYNSQREQPAPNIHSQIQQSEREPQCSDLRLLSKEESLGKGELAPSRHGSGMTSQPSCQKTETEDSAISARDKMSVKKRHHRGVHDKTWLPLLCLPAFGSFTEKKTTGKAVLGLNGSLSERNFCPPLSNRDLTPRTKKGSVTSRLKSFLTGTAVLQCCTHIQFNLTAAFYSIHRPRGKRVRARHHDSSPFRLQSVNWLKQPKHSCWK